MPYKVNCKLSYNWSIVVTNFIFICLILLFESNIVFYLNYFSRKSMHVRKYIQVIFQNIWERLLWKFSKKYCFIKLQPTSLNAVCPVTMLNLSFALKSLFDINLQIFLSTLPQNLANTNFLLPLRISKSLLWMSSSITFTIFFCDRLPWKN